MSVLYRRTKNRAVNRRDWARLAKRAGDAVVLVNWEDIQGDHTWRTLDVIRNDLTVCMFTAGWVVAVHADRLILVSTRYSIENEASGGYSTAIPAGCVIKVTKW